MNNCPNCNVENNDDALFCSGCGNKLGGESPDVNLNTQNTDLKDSLPTANDTVEPAAEPSVSYNSQPSPKKKSKVLPIVIGLVAVFAIVFFLFRVITNANPANKLVKGLTGLVKNDKMTATTTLKMEYDGKNDELEILDGLEVKLQAAADVNNLFAQISLELLYDKKSVVQIVAGANNELLQVDLKDLYNKKFYQEIDEFAPDYADFVNDYKIVKKAFDKISIKYDEKKYIGIVKDVMEDDIDKSGSDIVVTIDNKNISKLAGKILKEAKKDAKLRESIRTNGLTFLNAIIKEDKKLEQIDVDDLEDIVEIFGDKDEFEDYYEEMIDNLSKSLDYSDLDRLPETVITFRFSGNNISGIDYSGEIEDIELTLKTDIKKGASISKIDKKNAIELEELFDDEDILEDITDNLVKTIKKNKALEEIIEDITGQDIEDVLEMLPYYMF